MERLTVPIGGGVDPQRAPDPARERRHRDDVRHARVEDRQRERAAAHAYSIALGSGTNPSGWQPIPSAAGTLDEQGRERRREKKFCAGTWEAGVMPKSLEEGRAVRCVGRDGRDAL